MLKVYEHKNPGVTLLLDPESNKIVEKHNDGKPLKFPSSNPIFQTDVKELQEVIENCSSFEKGYIIKVPTPEEIALLKREADEKLVRETLAKIPGVKVNDDQIKKALDAIDEGESPEEKNDKLAAAKKNRLAALEKARAAKAAKAAGK